MSTSQASGKHLHGGAEVVYVQLLIFCLKPHCLMIHTYQLSAACQVLLARCPCSASAAAHLLMRVHVRLANGVNDTVTTPEGIASQLTDVLGKGGTEQHCLAGLL